jgi:hypothetical protein
MWRARVTNVTMYAQQCAALCTVELHVTAINTKVLSVEQQRFYGEFTSPVKNETYLGVHVTRHFCPIVTKFGFARQIFTEAPMYQISRISVQWERR